MRRLVVTALLWALISFLGGLLLILALPRAMGGQSMAVLSGSMAPAVETGDEVIVMPEPVEQLEPGQIAVFDDPDSGRLLNHRVQSIVEGADGVHVVTLGDANTAPERWSVPAGQEVGKVVARVPKIGFVLGRLNTRIALLFAVVLPALVLAAWLLTSIWKAPEGPVGTEPGP
ncbi:MAG: signal peptidase I [Solirubrobacterales bacterium]|nr:signal peptidase I [Solirubrobacterales bacterium]